MCTAAKRKRLQKRLAASEILSYNGVIHIQQAVCHVDAVHENLLWCDGLKPGKETINSKIKHILKKKIEQMWAARGRVKFEKQVLVC